MKNTIEIIFLLLFVVSITESYAQQDSTKLKQEVEVTKAYKPTVSDDARKINDIPQIIEQKPQKPDFNYSIYSEPIFSTFSVKSVKAATMVGTPETEINNGLLKLGFGSYLSPYGELFYNAIPDRKSNFGIHFKHYSSFGKAKLSNNDKVEAPFSDNHAEIFHKQFYRNSTLKLTAFFDHNGFNYYGYAGDALTDTEKSAIMPSWDQKQAFTKGGMKAHLKSDQISKTKLNYDLGLYYHYFGTKTSQKENFGKIHANFNKNFSTFKGFLASGISYYKADNINNRLNFSTQRQQILLNVNPSVLLEQGTGSVKVGAKMFLMFDDDVSARFLVTPDILLEWSPVEDILTLYAGADGKLQQNTYSKSAYFNQFQRPDHDIADTEYQYIIKGGFKGKISSKTNYNFVTSFSNIKDQAFYYLNATDLSISGSASRTINNQFDVLYDDLKLLKFSGEIVHAASKTFSFKLNGNYYQYNLSTLAQAWNLPEFDIDFSLILKTNSPLSFSLNSYIIGKRNTLLRNLSSSTGTSSDIIYSLDPVFDLNASAEYQYTDRISFFINLNNFAFQKYDSWLGYTNQSFNALIGANLTF